MGSRPHVRTSASPLAARAIAGLFALSAGMFMLGCGEPPTPPRDRSDLRESPTTPFGDLADRRHDFGAVVGRPGRTLTHAYLLTNSTSGPVKVLQAVNAKPCCGDVAMGPATLEPGQSATLEVTVRVGGSIGPLSHRAIVETDHPAAAQLEFWTLADVHPRLRIEEADQDLPALRPGATERREFAALAYGTADDPPIDLDGPMFRSDLEADWSGPAEDSPLANGLVERSRPFAVALEAGAEPGLRTGELRIVDRGGEFLLGYPLRWEVVPAIKATPSGIVITPSSTVRDPKILLQAQDGRAFRVLGVESDLPGIVAEPPRPESGATQVLRLAIEPGPGNAGRPGTIAVTTDHPDQPRIDLTVYVSGSVSSRSEAEMLP